MAAEHGREGTLVLILSHNNPDPHLGKILPGFLSSRVETGLEKVPKNAHFHPVDQKTWQDRRYDGMDSICSAARPGGMISVLQLHFNKRINFQIMWWVGVKMTEPNKPELQREDLQ